MSKKIVRTKASEPAWIKSIMPEPAETIETLHYEVDVTCFRRSKRGAYKHTRCFPFALADLFAAVECVKFYQARGGIHALRLRKVETVKDVVNPWYEHMSDVCPC